MDFASDTKQPTAYIDTGKAALLAIIKLLEALAACYALWVLITKPLAIQTVLDSFASFLPSGNNSQGVFENIYHMLIGFDKVIIGAILSLVILDGIGVFMTRFTHKGVSLVNLCHFISYLISILSFLSIIALFVLYFAGVLKITEASEQLSMNDWFSFWASYDMMLYIIITFGGLWIMAGYHRCILRVMKQVKREINTGEIQEFKKKNKLGRESAWFAGILTVSVVLSIVELLGKGSQIALIASFIKPVEILRRGSNWVSLLICAVFAIKFFLVNRCSADFDRAHR